MAFLWHVAPCGERRAVRILFAMFFSRGRENGRRCVFLLNGLLDTEVTQQ